MPLTRAQEERDYELTIEQMQTNIEKLRSDIKYESRNSAAQRIVRTAVCAGAGVTLANYVNGHQPTPQSALQPQILQPQIIIIPAPSGPLHN